MTSLPSRVASESGHGSYPLPALSRYEHSLRVVELTVELLIARAMLGETWQAGLEDADRLLAALPLPTSEYASASRHLQNAASYCDQQEYGAAAFELRAVRGHLQRI